MIRERLLKEGATGTDKWVAESHDSSDARSEGHISAPLVLPRVLLNCYTSRVQTRSGSPPRSLSILMQLIRLV